MTTTTATPAHFDMGRVISRTFGAIGKNFPTFAALTFILYSIPQFLVQWGVGFMGEGFPLGARMAGSLLALVGFIVSFILIFVLQACLVHGTVSFLRGQPAS